MLGAESEDEADVLGAIFTTMRLNEGYFGGPLLNTNGGIIGVSVVEEETNTSFVIPSSELKALLEEFRGEPLEEDEEEAT